MAKEDPRYPLTWPDGWKRTAPDKRKASDFRETAMVDRKQWEPGAGYKTSTVKGTRQVTMRTACTRLQDQMERLGGKDLILSTNIELTIYGEPKGGRKDPTDPGAAVYFQLLGKERVMACDRWLTVAENIAAIASHIDAIRRVDRYGVGNLEQAFTGYDRLPPPSMENRPAWRKILGFKPFATVTVDDVAVMYRALAKTAALDEGRLLELNLAKQAALQELLHEA